MGTNCKITLLRKMYLKLIMHVFCTLQCILINLKKKNMCASYTAPSCTWIASFAANFACFLALWASYVQDWAFFSAPSIRVWSISAAKDLELLLSCKPDSFIMFSRPVWPLLYTNVASKYCNLHNVNSRTWCFWTQLPNQGIERLISILCAP